MQAKSSSQLYTSMAFDNKYEAPSLKSIRLDGKDSPLKEKPYRPQLQCLSIYEQRLNSTFARCTVGAFSILNCGLVQIFEY